jgi:hypothetical protein
MADDARRDQTEPDRPDDPSALCPSAAERREVDLEQLRQRVLIVWKEALDAEIARFRAATLLEQFERQGDVARAAEVDQVAAGLRDEGFDNHWNRKSG